MPNLPAIEGVVDRRHPVLVPGEGFQKIHSTFVDFLPMTEG
jgi:hypothetical protein